MNYLVLLRHGQSEWNKLNLFTGFKDVELTEEGRAEARKAGQLLKDSDIHFDHLFTSTLKRANDTAELALDESEQSGLWSKVIRHEDLRERDYGDLTGLNKEETRQKYGDEQFKIWRRGYDTPPPGGECLKDVVENRVRPYFENNIKEKLEAGDNVLIVAHGNSLRAMMIVLEQRTPEDINEFEIPTGVPLVLEINEGNISKHYFLS